MLNTNNNLDWVVNELIKGNKIKTNILATTPLKNKNTSTLSPSPKH